MVDHEAIQAGCAEIGRKLAEARKVFADFKDAWDESVSKFPHRYS